jgi:hypothetical protein
VIGVITVIILFVILLAVIITYITKGRIHIVPKPETIASTSGSFSWNFGERGRDFVDTF